MLSGVAREGSPSEIDRVPEQRKGNAAFRDGRRKTSLLFSVDANDGTETLDAAELDERGVERLKRIWLELRRTNVFPFSPIAGILGPSGKPTYINPSYTRFDYFSAAERNGTL